MVAKSDRRNHYGIVPDWGDVIGGGSRRSAVLQIQMRLTTLVDMLEREVGPSSSARATLAELLAERGLDNEAAAQRRKARASGDRRTRARHGDTGR